MGKKFIIFGADMGSYVNVSEEFTINNMKKKTGLKGIVSFFSDNFNLIDSNDILEIHRYLMEEK